MSDVPKDCRPCLALQKVMVIENEWTALRVSFHERLIKLQEQFLERSTETTRILTALVEGQAALQEKVAALFELIINGKEG